MLNPIPQTGVTGGRVEPSSPPHDRGHDGPQSVAGDPAILRRTGRTADVRPRRNNQPRSAALSGMRRGHEGHRRPSPRRPMGLDPRHRRSGATLHEPALTIPPTTSFRPQCHRAANWRPSKRLAPSRRRSRHPMPLARAPGTSEPRFTADRSAKPPCSPRLTPTRSVDNPKPLTQSP
jgi:hypothetical protein